MMALGITFYACKKENSDLNLKTEKLVRQKCLEETKGGLSTSSTSPYNIYLYDITNNGNGTYTWEWRVRHLTSGNGKPGTSTVQDLSNWGITLGDCIKTQNIVSGSTSSNGSTWKSFTPEFKIDKSQDCYNQSLVKFDVGTKNSDISYYRLTINKNVSHTQVPVLYKSGKNTGCGTLKTCGFGCE